MVRHTMYSLYADGVDIRSPLQDNFPGGVSFFEGEEPLPGEMSVMELAEGCKREICKYRSGEAYDERYCLELLRRATMQSDHAAWEYLQYLFSDLVRSWLHRHPGREAAYRLDSEENYIAQTFERFWQATSQNQHIEFKTTASALQYLRASLQGVLLDTLRSFSQRRQIPLPGTDSYGELYEEDNMDGNEVWEVLHKMLPDAREQRLVYLLYHCGLKPREIVRFCPGEFCDIQEIYHMRRNIIDRLRRNAHLLRWRLA